MSTLPSGTVTLLFTDIEGSTQLLRRLGDGYALALAEHHRLLRKAFAIHDGHEVDNQGDSFFVAFARPLDAVLAAAEAQQALSSYPWPEGSTVRVRMGLHTGQPLLTDGRYLGLDVHQAARIEAAAHGGQVLVSEAMARLLPERLPEGLELRRLGDHRLKDFVQPEPLFQLLISGLPGSFPPLRTAKPEPEVDTGTGTRATGTAIVGRESELALLRERLKAAQAGQGSLVLLAGEPGIGKTRLAEELAGEARHNGMTVLWGRCWEGEGAPAFWPWLQLLQTYCERQSPLTLRAELGSGAAEIAQLLPDLRQRLPDLPGETAAPGSGDRPAADPDAARFRQFQAVTHLFRNAAQARPLLLLVDDLHWADKASLLLLQFLTRDLGEARLLVVGTYRDTDLDRRHPLAEVLASLRRAPRFERLLLHGLSREEVERLLEAQAGHGPVATGRAKPASPLPYPGQRLAEVLWRETEGNPFFIGEVLRHLAENGTLRQQEGRWSMASGSIAELGIPEGVREVIGRRLSRLSEETNRLLTVAAVVGREFDAATLERVTGADADAVDAALEEAEAAHVVERLPRSLTGCRFSHALIRETLREELPPRRRVRLHRQVGEALEQQYARGLDSHLSELAYHFLEGAAGGGDIERAIDYARRAAERALGQYAYEAAVRQYEAALAPLAETDAADTVLRCDLLLLLANALNEAGEPRRVLDDVGVAAFDLAEALGDAERAGRACEQAWQALYYEEGIEGLWSPEAGAWADRAGRWARPDTAEQVRADLLSLGPLWAAQDWPGVVTLVTRALEVARKLEDLELRWQAAWYWLLCVAAPRHAEAQLQLAEELQTWPRTGVRTGTVQNGLFYSGWVNLAQGQRQPVERLWREAASLGERTGQAIARLRGMAHLALLSTLGGELEEAVALAEQMVALGEDLGLAGVARSMRGLGSRRALLYLGRAEEGLRLATIPSSQMFWRAHLGQVEKAWPLLDEWVVRRSGIGSDQDETPAFIDCTVLEAAVLVGHREAAALALQRLGEWRPAVAGYWPVTCPARHLGAAAALLGDHEAAVRHTEQAIRDAEQVQFRPELALAHLQLAELLSGGDRGQGIGDSGQGTGDSGQGTGDSGQGTGDREAAHGLNPQFADLRAGLVEAREHLAFAIPELETMGMRPALERARRLQERLDQ